MGCPLVTPDPSLPHAGGISRRPLERSVAFHGDDGVRDHEMRGQGAVDIEDARGRSLPTVFRPAIDRAGDGANDAAEGQRTERDPYLQSASAEPARAGPEGVFFPAGLPANAAFLIGRRVAQPEIRLYDPARSAFAAAGTSVNTWRPGRIYGTPGGYPRSRTSAGMREFAWPE